MILTADFMSLILARRAHILVTDRVVEYVVVLRQIRAAGLKALLKT